MRGVITAEWSLSKGLLEEGPFCKALRGRKYVYKKQQENLSKGNVFISISTLGWFQCKVLDFQNK